MMTLSTIIAHLRGVEETLAVELLDLKTDDLVDAFLEKVEERSAYLEKFFGEE